MLNIILCTPNYGDLKAEFARSVSRLLIYTFKRGLPSPVGRVAPDIDHLMLSSSNLPHNRESIAEHALNCEADYLLWLDTDQIFPPHTLERLLAVKQPVVGCNYGRRVHPTAPTTFKIVNGKREMVWTTAKLAKDGIVERVHSMGLGVCLMEAKALRAIERPWFEWGPHGEDGYFFDKLAAAGIPAFVDHPLSWEVGHISQTVVTNADAVADKAAWLKQKGPSIGLGRPRR